MKTRITHLFNYSIVMAMIVMLSSNRSLAQNQNSLAFDGTDDLVTTPAASALISGSSNISITCWVYPANPTPQTTSYDGICGFRNNADGDFYLLHYSANTLECRFRNSAGLNFDLTGTGIVVNTWQHLAFTYDGSMLRYYLNGVATDSLAANGTITVTGDNFYIGGLPYLTYIFNLEGMVDEVTLWNKTLSLSDVNYVYGGCLDPTDPDLMLYYKFNQGTAGGNNTTITTVTDESGHIDGTLNNFLMNGTGSNFVTGVPGANNSVSAGICTGESYQFGSQVLTTAGVYTDTLTSVYGCDSIVTLTLSVSTADTSVSLFGSNVLHSNQGGANYTWVNCNNGFAIIPGATSQNYVVSTAGNYAVVVSYNGCIDTSNCHTVTFAGIEENSLAAYVHVYPNPVADYLSVSMEHQLLNASIEIADVTGRKVWQSAGQVSDKLKIDASKWMAGIYSLKVTTDSGNAVVRIVKK